MRQEKIVEYLYAKKQAIAPKALAAEFQISERTLANDIKWLRDIGRTEGFSIERIRSAGYQLEISDKKKFLRFLSHAKRQEKIDNGNPNELRISNFSCCFMKNTLRCSRFQNG